jgi:hypothetical protein
VDLAAAGLEGHQETTVVVEELVTSGADLGEDRHSGGPAVLEPDVYARVEPAGRVAGRLHLELGPDALIAEPDDDRADIAADVEQRRTLGGMVVVVVSVAHAAGTE